MAEKDYLDYDTPPEMKLKPQATPMSDSSVESEPLLPPWHPSRQMTPAELERFKIGGDPGPAFTPRLPTPFNKIIPDVVIDRGDMPASHRVGFYGGGKMAHLEVNLCSTLVEVGDQLKEKLDLPEARIGFKYVGEPYGRDGCVGDTIARFHRNFLPSEGPFVLRLDIRETGMAEKGWKAHEWEVEVSDLQRWGETTPHLAVETSGGPIRLLADEWDRAPYINKMLAQKLHQSWPPLHLLCKVPAHLTLQDLGLGSGSTVWIRGEAIVARGAAASDNSSEGADDADDEVVNDGKEAEDAAHDEDAADDEGGAAAAGAASNGAAGDARTDAERTAAAKGKAAAFDFAAATGNDKGKGKAVASAEEAALPFITPPRKLPAPGAQGESVRSMRRYERNLGATGADATTAATSTEEAGPSNAPGADQE